MKRVIELIFIGMLTVQVAWGQQPVSLEDCQQWAREYHPLLQQKELYEQMGTLKLENNETNKLPQVDLNAQATYQTDVTEVGIALPNVAIPGQAKDQYKMYLDVKQSIWDGGLTKANAILEQARTATNLQAVEVELYQLREQVNSLFFSSFLIQQNLALLERKLETLTARETQMFSAVENGMRLESDLDQIRAEQVKVKQQQLELQSQRETVVAALAILTGKHPDDLQQLEIESQQPDLNQLPGRPELALFETQTSLLAASSDLLQKKRNPKLFGFGQAGYGRPGLNMLSSDFDTYALVGLGVSWSAFDWKNTRREKEIIQIQQDLVTTRERQFERNIRIALDGEYRKMEQLKALLLSDQELIDLQARITASAASKLENGTITTSDYLQDLNAELAARIALETHKAQLEAAKVNYQTIKGNNP
ncbi:TolC family protein [uncultured Sunxiuqinia sp.]|uniref:TolC family protein n=1 Tax=uncultured Sunxiuqinia sp. TaxID=1573825 RepID=UPI0026138F45|nr:TolC family protein [uncultured Sunxiuqinia sp.]